MLGSSPSSCLFAARLAGGVKEASWGWLVDAYHTKSSAASTTVPETALHVGGPGDGVSNRFPI